MKKYIFVLIMIISIFLLSNIQIESETSVNSLIQVEVRGEVKNPGTFKLEKGSKFEDLLKLIEIDSEGDLSTHSLSEVLYNKQIVVITKKSENNNKISINSATLNQLCLLPGIGESTAQKIIDYRTNNGSFNSLDELKNISGIGDKKYEKLLEYITL